ncbi:L,D-transpeptidase family protein [Moritella sp. Urea-trap-13]|uniref:L,D-transpeptidase family protein n=1 Tax=Moritella sp. Urea-trap-13 TaxID=2058327 RepID=UPI000C33F31E|nr:L,D-transpeptidase family protein [Moritella sp. Urea-trap-13]PKH06386.1 peptidoglycan-binding protein [Moritella sp. Urea-trap-13]
MLIKSKLKFLSKPLVILSLLFVEAVNAQQYTLPSAGSRLIGERVQHKVQVGDYFHSVSKQYNIGLIALMASNPSVDPFLPLPGTKLDLPTVMLLPEVEHKGIVINLPELRLYYFPKNTNKVHVFPVGIGREGRETPQMKSVVKLKLKDPVWTPTQTTRAEYLDKHKMVLPRVVPAGKHNPLGNFALQLAYGKSNYLIHGTNSDFGIGMRVSAGCIRMNPDDIEWLYNNVKVNESVRIINRPIKFTLEPNGEHLLEVHSPLSSKTLNRDVDGSKVINSLKDNNRVDSNTVKETVLLHYGLPINVSI